MRNNIKLNIDDLIEKHGVAKTLKYIRVFCFTPKIYQKDFAKEIGLSKDMVKSIESDRRKPSAKVLNKIREIVE